MYKLQVFYSFLLIKRLNDIENKDSQVFIFSETVKFFAVGVLGQEWETSEIETVTPYKAFTNQEIHAKVGIKIGLGSVNITLKGCLTFF